jgi:hypothetical protein
MTNDDLIGEFFLPLQSISASAVTAPAWHQLHNYSTEARATATRALPQADPAGEVRLSLKMVGTEEAAAVSVEALCVRVIGARNLTSSSLAGGSPDKPYVTLEFRDKAESRVQTKATSAPQSTAPLWKQRFELLLSAEADESVLDVRVWDKDLAGPDELLGRALLPLEAIRQDLSAGEERIRALPSTVSRNAMSAQSHGSNAIAD